MKKILDIIDNYIIILDKMGKIIFCNQKILQKLNYNMEELDLKSIDTVIEGIDIFDENKYKNLILKYISKDEKIIHLRTKIVKEDDDTIAIIGEDIVKTTYTVNELEQMIDNLPFNCWLKNVEGQYLYVNESYAKELNDTKNNIIGKTSKDYWSKEQAKQFSAMDDEVIKSKKYQVTERYSIKDNSEIWTETYKAPILNKENEVEYLIGYTKDITLQKEIDSEFQNNNQINDINNILVRSDKEKSMEEFLSNIGDSIIKYLECDSLRIFLINKKNNSIDLDIECGKKDKNKFNYKNFIESDYTIESIINYKHINSIININEFEDDNIRYFMKNSEIENIGIYSILVDDEVAGFLVLKFLKNNNLKFNKFDYIKNICNNMAHLIKTNLLSQKLKDEFEIRKKIEETIQMESLKSEFFANISHEFRTPLNIILGTMQLIQRYIDKDKISWDESLNFETHIHYIRQNSYRLLRLVNNLIDMTCIDSGYFKIELGNYNIISIIESITLSVVDYIEEKGINLVFDTNIEEVIIACDPEKIERIMLNLLSNAIKYTEKQGYIEVNINAMDSMVRISVKDNGMGISEDKLNVIFDRFKRIDSELNRKCEGSGIGLSLVKSLVELQNGKIYAKSELGIGTEFVFEMPIMNVSNGIENISESEVINHTQIEKCNIEFSDIYS